MSVDVYVGVGSNIEPGRHVRAALADMEQRFGPLRVSPVYRTQAVGFDGADFLNLVAAFATDEDVHAVDAALNELERANGRRPGGPRFAARSIDLDLLLYGDLVLHEPGLVLPRPEILEHAFVLKPLADLAPDLAHPLSGESYAQKWRRFRSPEAPPVPVSLDFSV